MPYFERKTTSGKLVEVERYFATRDGKRLPRAGNESESTEEQQKLNERHAQKRLMRLINANFDGPVCHVHPCGGHFREAGPERGTESD